MIFKNGFISEEQFTFPNILNVCVYKGACTANCVHCPLGKTNVRDRKTKFGDSSMNIELYKKIVDEITKYKHATLRIHSVGEPTLWKDLPAAIDYSYSKNVITWIFTNGITSKKTLLEHILKKCTIVEVSVNSFDAENYKYTKGVDSYNIVFENIKFMHKYIMENKLKTRLLLSRVESEDKEYDVQFLKYWKDSGLAADVFVRSYHSYNSIIEDKLKRKKVVACNVHWSRFNIDTNGDVVVCYNELFRGPQLDSTLILGNIKKQSISEIWHGDKLSKIRDSQYNDKPELIDFTKNMPCQDCHYCQPLNSNTPKSEVQIQQLQKIGY